MFYENVSNGLFLSRPNRFLARVMLNGKEIVCHVKNTGRLKELLIPGVPVGVQYHPDAAFLGRKTEYSLISVAKPADEHAVLSGGRDLFRAENGLLFRWVNIDSQAPNQAAFEWLSTGHGLPFCPRPQEIRREVRYGLSRFDLSFSDCGTPWFMEVKGVTLDVNGTAMFPDAPTDRGIKHLDALGAAVRDGYGAAALFVIQMKGICVFRPNDETHKAFGDALREAAHAGVQILAWECHVENDSMTVIRPVPVERADRKKKE